MVSPSKKKRTERKGREIQPQTPLNNDNQPDSKKTVKSARKPLATKKVYLDIRSNAVSTKLEKDLKQLGARIEQFLDAEVDYFVTDRPVPKTAVNNSNNKTAVGNNNPNLNNNSPALTPSPFTPGGAPTPSPSAGLLSGGGGGCSSAVGGPLLPSPCPSPAAGGGGGNAAANGRPASHHHVTRSRAEAMLDCVRDVITLNNHHHNHHPSNHQSSINHHSTVDPIENARALNVPIYQVQQFVRWVDKLVARVRSGAAGVGGGSSRVKVLSKQFVKLESVARRRPEFRELDAWPELRYEGALGGPFEPREAAAGGPGVGARRGGRQNNNANSAAANNRPTTEQQVKARSTRQRQEADRYE
ncbi:protein DBF4 homolog A-like [Nilaparvata lugens]|uniref:protein DBF4 homolog A-like n=1 Tax=Nilaparvata lugens TaxID=108931 RepID=UPI00193D99E2|nr:protein DBF4 homolog A-like [Nilaparvata lugens]